MKSINYIKRFTRQLELRLNKMSVMKILIFFIGLLVVSQSYEQIDDHKQIMAYYEQNSFMPVMHVYYNRHFSKSKQWKGFLETIEETEYEVGSYAKIMLTDCEYEKSGENMACNEIKRINQNRMIIGYHPNSKFTSFGDKVMQAPPSNRVFDQFSDTYTVEQLKGFINQLLPNFLKEIRNTHQFQSFKSPKYVPKLVFAAQEGDVPQVIRQLGVEFFLKFDMAYVEDLTESVVNQLEIKKFPTLLVLKHNFESGKLEIFPYPSHDFSQQNSDSIRKFLQTHALKQRRNDYVFHLIDMPRSDEVQTVDNSADLQKTLDKIKSWVFLEEGPSFEKLIQLKSKYGLFYDYVHFLKPEDTAQKTFIMNPRVDFKLPFDQRGIEYRMINAEDLHSNMTLWLKKDYIVMGVRQQYGYLCTMIDKPLFRGMAQCFIVDENSYEQVTENIKMKFKYGFVVSAKNHANGTTRVNGNEIKTLVFEDIYRMLEYTTKLKVKDIIDGFMDHPVKNLTVSTEIQQLCAEPYKKCILYFYQPSSDKTKLQYLELQALDFVNEYKIYAIDLSCNDHMYEQIPQLKQNHGGLIAFHPRMGKYVYLKAKMTRNVIRKFLEINNEEKKTLPFKIFTTERTQIYNCNQKKDNRSQDLKQNSEQFAQEL